MADPAAPPPPPAALPPAALTPREAAGYLSMSRSTLDELALAGLVPAPIRIGKKVLYGRAELDAWLAHGGPPHADWKPLWRKFQGKHPH